MVHPLNFSAAAAAFVDRRLTPLDLVEQCLEHIKAWEHETHAWVIVDAEGARRAAEQATRALAEGRSKGPLHGIPIAIKNIVDVAGLATRAGSTLTSDRPASGDATVVARLRAAGAIVLGKTVTTEFACFDPPPTTNPWNTDHTPGGSSSGSAAATALGMCLGAIGSQTGGSITRPASYCGVSGIKPTFGRISRAGVVPVSFHLDHVGTMARSVADCGLLLSAIDGFDPLDPASTWRSDSPWSAGSLRANGQPPRLAVPRRFFFEAADAETAKLTDEKLASLAAAGATLVDVPLPPGFDNVHVMHRRLMACEAADFHRRQYGEHPLFQATQGGYQPGMAALIAEGFRVSMADYQEALRHQAGFRAAVAESLAGFDAMVTPATPGPAPADRSTTGDPRFNSPWSHAGVPTVSFPCALTASWMPIALQLIGAAWSEERLIPTAIWCEEMIGFESVPPQLRK